ARSADVRRRARQRAARRLSSRRAARYEVVQPTSELRTEIFSLARKPYDGLQVVGAVTGVVAATAEHETVHRATLIAPATCQRIQRIGQLDLAAATGCCVAQHV